MLPWNHGIAFSFTSHLRGGSGAPPPVVGDNDAVPATPLGHAVDPVLSIYRFGVRPKLLPDTLLLIAPKLFMLLLFVVAGE